MLQRIEEVGSERMLSLYPSLLSAGAPLARNIQQRAEASAGFGSGSAPRCRSFSCIHQIRLAHPAFRLYSHPICGCIREVARNDSHHYRLEEIYIYFRAVSAFQASSAQHLSHRFVLNLLLSDVELSRCANSMHYVETKLVTVARLFRSEGGKKRL